MALNLKYSVSNLINNELDEITGAIGASGKLKIYADTQPTSVDTALGAQVLIATLPLSATAAPAASGGTLTFNAITDDSSADATDTATWFTVTTSADVRIIDGTVGTSGTDMIIDSTNITAGQVISCSSFVITGGNA